MFYGNLDEKQLSNLLEFFQKQQAECFKLLNEVTDPKQTKKIQNKITIYNSLVINITKLRTIIKAENL